MGGTAEHSASNPSDTALAGSILGLTSLGIATAAGLFAANAIPFLAPVIDPLVALAIL